MSTQANLQFYKDIGLQAFVRKVDGGYYLNLGGIEYVRDTKAEIETIINAELATKKSDIDFSTLESEYDAQVTKFKSELTAVI